VWRALPAGLAMAGFYGWVDFGSSAMSMGAAVAIGGAIYVGMLFALREPLLGALCAGRVRSGPGADAGPIP